MTKDFNTFLITEQNPDTVKNKKLFIAEKF